MLRTGKTGLFSPVSIFGLILVDMHAKFYGTRSVSYTHLDVYKRQEIIVLQVESCWQLSELWSTSINTSMGESFHYVPTMPHLCYKERVVGNCQSFGALP